MGHVCSTSDDAVAAAPAGSATPAAGASNGARACRSCAVELRDAAVDDCTRCGARWRPPEAADAPPPPPQPFACVQLGVFYESLPARMRGRRAAAKDAAGSPVTASAASSEVAPSVQPVPALPPVRLSPAHSAELMARHILPFLLQRGDSLPLCVGQHFVVPVGAQPAAPDPAASAASSSASPLSPGVSSGSAPAARAKVSGLKLKVLRAWPPSGFVSVSSEVTLAPYVISLTRQLKSVTILPLQSTATRRAAPAAAALDQEAVLRDFLRPHFATLKSKHLFEGYVFASQGVQFKVASAEPSDGCLSKSTSVFCYFHPLIELRKLELVPVAHSFPVDPATNEPRLPSEEAALTDFLRPFFRSENFSAFTRESVIAIPHSEIVEAGDAVRSPTLWKIVSLEPAAGGLVTGQTLLSCSGVKAGGMSRAEYLRRQESEDGEYARLVQTQQTIQCSSVVSVGGQDDEWMKQQRLASTLKERLGASLARMDRDARHALFVQCYNTLDTLSVMRPGTVPLSHLTAMISNAQLALGERSGLANGATAAEISSLPTRIFKPVAAALSPPAPGSDPSAPPQHRLASKASADKPVDESTTCMICLAAYEPGEQLRVLLCFHGYHSSCIDPWLRDHSSCPTCRSPIS